MKIMTDLYISYMEFQNARVVNEKNVIIST